MTEPNDKLELAELVGAVVEHLNWEKSSFLAGLPRSSMKQIAEMINEAKGQAATGDSETGHSFHQVAPTDSASTSPEAPRKKEAFNPFATPLSSPKPKKEVEMPSKKGKAAAKTAPQSLFDEGPTGSWKGRTESQEAVQRELDELNEEIGPCTRCKLHKERTNLVFGVGNPKARLLFAGEGPGYDEDQQGEPFVGRAGKLLDKIILAMGLQRSDVYICNVVKCRPPGNRNPEADEMDTCGVFLKRQIEIIKPEVIVALGAVPARYLLSYKGPIGAIRGQFLAWMGTVLLPTYHPAYLLRNPSAKKVVWEDMQKVMDRLGLEDPRKKGG